MSEPQNVEAYNNARSLALSELEKATKQKAQLEKHISRLKAAVMSLDMMLEENEAHECVDVGGQPKVEQ